MVREISPFTLINPFAMKRTEVNSIWERVKSSGGCAGQLTTNQNYLNAAVKQKKKEKRSSDWPVKSVNE